MSTIRQLMFLVIFALVLAGCGGNAATQPTTVPENTMETVAPEAYPEPQLEDYPAPEDTQSYPAPESNSSTSSNAG